MTKLLESISCNKGILIVTGLMGLSMQTLRKQDWTEFSWRDKVYNAKFSLEIRLDHGFAMEYTHIHSLYLFEHYCHYCR